MINVDLSASKTDVTLVRVAVAFGLNPAHLAIRPDGAQDGDRLRGGESVGSIVARLREAGHFANAA